MAEYVDLADALGRHAAAYPDLAHSIAEQSFQRERVNYIASRIGSGDRVLDVGCNSGYFANFCPPGAEVHGVDVNPRLVAEAAKRLVSAEVAPAENLPFGDREFDVVCLGGVLELCFNPEVVLREALRVAGRCVIGTTCHADGGWGRARVPSHPWHARSFDRAEIAALLNRCGEIGDLRTLDFGAVPQCWGFVVTPFFHSEAAP